VNVDIELVPFEPKHLPLVEPWFDDPRVQSRLGGREWPGREFRLMAEPPGTEFRGAIVTGRFDWVALDGEETVGLIVGETYDRWATYGGDGPSGPIILDTIELPAMGLAFVVDPLRWRRVLQGDGSGGAGSPRCRRRARVRRGGRARQ